MVGKEHEDGDGDAHSPLPNLQHEALGPTELSLPFARVKKLMKEQDDVKNVSAEAVFLVGRATELLLQELTEHAEGHVQHADRKTLLIKDMAAAVRSMNALEFLYDVIPEKVVYSQVKQGDQ